MQRLKRYSFNYTTSPGVVDTFTVNLPGGARVHTIEVKNGQSFLWATADDALTERAYTFAVAEHNDVMGPLASAKFIALVQLQNRTRLFFQLTQ